MFTGKLIYCTKKSTILKYVLIFYVFNNIL